jgi:geranylgeranyl pyrophosphate synthase
VVAGQYLDLVSQAIGRSDEDLALRVVRFKAASYTVVRPLHIGAALAGADETLLAALTAYGEPLGIAFQLRDDILGVFGDPEQTGKPAVTTCARASGPSCWLGRRRAADPGRPGPARPLRRSTPTSPPTT